MSRINPDYFLKTFGPRAAHFLMEDPAGVRLYNKVLKVKGCHISLIGQPDSGKTRKMHWLATWLKELEVIVWIDSCKDEEIGPLFFMGKPVNIIIPTGMKIEIKNLGTDYTVREAFLPDQFWDLVDPDKINIFSIRNYFFDERERSRFYAKLFRALAIRSSEEWFRDVKGIKRMSVFIDEAQRIVPSTSFSHEPEALAVAQDVTANLLEMRAYGIRLIMGTQDYMNVYPAARRNMPARIFCHGAVVKSDESRTMHRLAEYSQNYAKWEGLLVFPDGDYYPRTCPWKFPDFPKPKGARIRYLRKVDRPLPKDEIERESLPDMGLYHDLVIEPERDRTVAPSRYDIAAGDL